MRNLATREVKMNNLGIDPLNIENFEIRPSERDGTIAVVFSGMIDIREPSKEILPYLLKIHEAILENAFNKIYIDLTGLDFMNSSGIKTFISWIMKVNEMPQEERYNITIIYGPDITWQQSSVKVIKRLFPDFIEVINP